MPRDDYREYLQLCVLFPGGIPPYGETFGTPAAGITLGGCRRYIRPEDRPFPPSTPRDLKSLEESAPFAAVAYVQLWVEVPLWNEALINASASFSAFKFSADVGCRLRALR